MKEGNHRWGGETMAAATTWWNIWRCIWTSCWPGNLAVIPPAVNSHVALARWTGAFGVFVRCKRSSYTRMTTRSDRKATRVISCKARMQQNMWKPQLVSTACSGNQLFRTA